MQYKFIEGVRDKGRTEYNKKNYIIMSPKMEKIMINLQEEERKRQLNNICWVDEMQQINDYIRFIHPYKLKKEWHN